MFSESLSIGGSVDHHAGDQTWVGMAFEKKNRSYMSSKFSILELSMFHHSGAPE